VLPGSGEARRVADLAEKAGAVTYGEEPYPWPHGREAFCLQFFDRRGRNVATYILGGSAKDVLLHPGGRLWGMRPLPRLPLSRLRGD
jgi:hypothetical protein